MSIRRIMVRLPEDTYREFRIRLAENDETAQKILEKAVDKYIAKHRQKKEGA